jgi:hypothetical protein
VSRTDARKADAAALVPVDGGVGALLLACHGQQIWRQRSRGRGARLGFRGFGGRCRGRRRGREKNGESLAARTAFWCASHAE